MHLVPAYLYKLWPEVRLEAFPGPFHRYTQTCHAVRAPHGLPQLANSDACGPENIQLGCDESSCGRPYSHSAMVPGDICLCGLGGVSIGVSDSVGWTH
jgi:hypothetical protein